MTGEELPHGSEYKLIVARAASGSFDETREEHWRPYVENLRQMGFDVGNDRVLSHLLAHIGIGLRWIMAKRADALPPHYRKPEIGTEDPRWRGSPKIKSCFAYVPNTNVIAINPIAFSLSRADPHRLLTLRTPPLSAHPNEVIFEGRSVDFFLLECGVHEGDHSLWFQAHPESTSTARSGRGEGTLAEYIVQPHELHALEMTIQASDELKMPAQTTAFLRHRYEEALQRREKR